MIKHSSKTRENFRNKLLSSIKIIYFEESQKLEKEFKKDNNGEKCVRGQSLLIDKMLRLVFLECLKELNINIQSSISIVAVGGYGRQELAPKSDIDILFLTPKTKSQLIKDLIQHILYLLWDAGFSIGHATRSVNEVLKDSKKDITIRTSILDRRFIEGNRFLYEELEHKFKNFQKKSIPIFIKSKLAERENRHLKMGGSRYMLEPNIKEGKGTLRDLHTLFWIAKYVYGLNNFFDIKGINISLKSELKRFIRAQKFLWSIRCHLHYLSNRNDNILNFDAQNKIALCFGYRNRKNILAVERFMKKFYLTVRDVGSLTRLICTEIDHIYSRKKLYPNQNKGEDFKSDNLVIEDGKVSIAGFVEINKNPGVIFKLFKFAQERNLEIHPNALNKVWRNQRLFSKKSLSELKVSNYFIQIMMSNNNAEGYLRLLSDFGVLGRLFKEYRKITAQMQFDMYHHYTADEHTIRAIGFIHKIINGELVDLAPVASEIIHEIQSKKVLFIAAFFHDIGKGHGSDHTIIGEKIFRNHASVLGLNDEEEETVAWLVRNHLLMSRIAFNFDISDPKTISDFCDIVQSPERLKLLLVLTVADILAVGPNIWNSWKAVLMRDLFSYAQEVLLGADAHSIIELSAIESIKKIEIALKGWSQKEFQNYTSNLSEKYWSAFDSETQVWHAYVSRNVSIEDKIIKVETKSDLKSKSIKLIVLAPNHTGLFSKIAGAIASQGIEILNARIFTRKDGIALDSFLIQTLNEKTIDEFKLEKIKATIINSLKGKFNPEIEIVKRFDSTSQKVKIMDSPARVFINNDLSNTQTVLEINGKDKLGLLYFLTKKLTELGIQIQSASVSTYGHRVVDVFYVKDIFGMKIINKPVINKIKDELKHILINYPS